jgi:hypothetical protein
MTTILPNERVAEIRARAGKATPGPWDNPGMATISLTFDRECNIYPPNTMESHGFQFGGPVAVVNYRGECDSNPDGADADFIATSRTDIPSLCDSHDAQAKRIGELEEEAEGYAGEAENLELRLAKALRESRDAGSEISTLKAKLVEAEKVIKKHHTWHIDQGEVSAPDGEGGYVSWNASDAYGESTMYGETADCLESIFAIGAASEAGKVSE